MQRRWARLSTASLPTLRRHINAFEEPLSGVDHQTCFAMKANANLAILSYMAHRGLGADVVSGGDLYRALKAGIPGGKIVYSGVGKTTAEIDMAIDAGIMMFNIESAQELEVINERAGMLGRKAPVSIRVNPDVDPMTHPYISTGLKENKFGIDVEGSLAQYLKAKDMENIEIVGIDCHIGSQLTDLSPFIDAVRRLKMLIEGSRNTDHAHTSTWAEGSASPIQTRSPPSPRLCQGRARRGGTSGPEADIRARQGDCGQRGCSRRPGALPQADQKQDLHRGGCGNE